MVFDDATLNVNFGTNVVSYSADYTFPAGSSAGIVQVRQSATLNGTRFAGQDGRDTLSGNFYGVNGEVAAGFFNQGNGSPTSLTGAFIVGE